MAGNVDIPISIFCPALELTVHREKSKARIETGNSVKPQQYGET
jgi:hypothetical protein